MHHMQQMIASHPDVQGSTNDVLIRCIEECQACARCAEECERHASNHEHCRICAEPCRRCEQACMAAARSIH